MFATLFDLFAPNRLRHHRVKIPKLNITAQWACSSSIKCPLFFAAVLKRASYISKWIGMRWTNGSKKKSWFKCVSMCLCAYAHIRSYVCVCVCKYVLMGPLIKTPGVSAICQHWSIDQETDSSPRACVRVCESERVLVRACAKGECVFLLSSGSLQGDRFICHSKVSLS